MNIQKVMSDPVVTVVKLAEAYVSVESRLSGLQEAEATRRSTVLDLQEAALFEASAPVAKELKEAQGALEDATQKVQAAERMLDKLRDSLSTRMEQDLRGFLDTGHAEAAQALRIERAELMEDFLRKLAAAVEAEERILGRRVLTFGLGSQAGSVFAAPEIRLLEPGMLDGAEQKILATELDRLRDPQIECIDHRQHDVSRKHREATERLERLDDEAQKALDAARAAVGAGGEH